MQCNSNVELGFAFATDSFNSASNIIANCSVQITKCGYIEKHTKLHAFLLLGIQKLTTRLAEPWTESGGVCCLI